MNRLRILDPIERFSEIVFGLIVVLSFTGAMSITRAEHGEVRHMMIAAILCNLAWGIIDAAFYLITCLGEHGHNISLLLAVQKSTDPEEAHKIIADALPKKVADALPAAEYARIREHLQNAPQPESHLRVTREDWLGALGVFLLVFLSTLPVVIPFAVIANPRLALHVSNGIAIVLLFGAGHMLARYAGLHRIWTGLAMVIIGLVLVVMTIALGG
jgi:hypothetical protein